MSRQLVFVVLVAILLDKSVKFSQSAPNHLKDYDVTEKLEELRRFEKDRENDREKLKTKVTQDVIGEIPPAGELFEGDMVMDEDLRQAVLGEADKRSIIKRKNKLWPNGIVPYKFDPDINPKSKSCVLKAIRSFKKHTCIKFVKRDTQHDYLYIRSEPSACMSYVGRRGGKQFVTLGKGCTRLGTCQHELFHALGFIHEQSRPDRDDHVKILWSNIRDQEKHNFNKYSYADVTDEGIAYDFMSVMHYPNHAFAMDRSVPTIVSKKDPSLVFGQRHMFSVGDVKTLNRMYKCKKDDYAYELPKVLSDEEVEHRRDVREKYDRFFV